MGGKPRPPNLRHRREPHPLAREVGARIRELRLDREFNFDAFVGMAEIGRGYASELERGLVVPSIDVLHRIARALDVTMADLVIGDSPRERLFELTAELSATDVAALTKEAERRRAARPPT
jgi:transcriptional regulator with XRE-family HTH domain